MNILPKKRWHVRTKDNIARVRRDEAEALEKEKEIQKRARLAEQEARINILRGKTRAVIEPITEREETKEPDKKDDIFTNSGNINFFKDIEAGIQGGSSIKKEEERKEKEAYEKKIGLLTQLGQDSMELSKGKYWFEDKSNFSFHKCQDSDNKEVGLKHKVSIDPLNEILKYTSSHLSTTIVKNIPMTTKNVEASITAPSKVHKRKKSKHKKDKKFDKRLKKKSKKKSKHRKYSRSDSEDELVKINKIKVLRKERLEREAKEKLRAERLLAGKNPDEKDTIPTQEAPHQKYSSQFNPNFARQNRNSL